MYSTSIRSKKSRPRLLLNPTKIFLLRRICVTTKRLIILSDVIGAWILITNNFNCHFDGPQRGQLRLTLNKPGCDSFSLSSCIFDMLSAVFLALALLLAFFLFVLKLSALTFGLICLLWSTLPSELQSRSYLHFVEKKSDADFSHSKENHFYLFDKNIAQIDF